MNESGYREGCWRRHSTRRYVLKIKMNYYGRHPSLKRDTEPIDDSLWHWFICHGPHGERFSWHRTIAVAPRDIEYLEIFIEERNETDPSFKVKARQIALEALENDDPIMVCTGIQVLTIVGEDADFKIIKDLVSTSNKEIAKNAKCCLFERKIK